LLVRLVEAGDLATTFWRSAFMALAVGCWLVLRYRGEAWNRIRAVGTPGVLSGLLLAATFTCYILALRHTTVANTLILMSAAPLIGAVLGWIILGERMMRSTWLAIVVALAGIGMTVVEDLTAGRMLGNTLAFTVAVLFACNTVVLRRYRQIDMVPANFLGGLFSALALLPFIQPLQVSAKDLGLLALLGSFQLGLGLFLFVRGSRFLRTAELGLVGLLEAVLAPVWVWLALGEIPSTKTLVGGAIVLAALVGYALVSMGTLPPTADARPRSGAAS
jgi:drug/metabolite transporter (DMT)-like permease